MRKKRKYLDSLKGYMFIGPNLIGFIVLTLFPVIFSLLLCFSEWNMIKGFSGLRFVGISNFQKLLTDIWFIESLKNNLLYTFVTVPISMVFGLLLALMLSKKIFANRVIKTFIFAPYLTNIVAVCAVWIMLFHPTHGPINAFLRSVGMDSPPKWLCDSRTSLWTVMILPIWKFTGYNMIIYLAGIKNIPKHLQEAAIIDGASGRKMFWHVTFPLLSPTTFFISITGIINSFKVFAPVSILTEGGPGTSSTVLVYYIYVSAFKFFKMGYASSIAWILFLGIFIVTIIQWQGQKKWVNYM